MPIFRRTTRLLGIAGLLLTMLCWAGCEFWTPSIVPSSPIFTLSGTLENSPFVLEAGNDNTYLYTDYQLGDDGVYTFISTLAATPLCSDNCLQSLRVAFKDYRATVPSAWSADSSFAPRDWAFRTTPAAPPAHHRAMRFALPSAMLSPFSTVVWDFGDGTTAQQPANATSVEHTYYFDQSAFDIYNVCVTYDDITSCTATYCQAINVRDYPTAYNNFRPDFDVTLLNNQTVQFAANATGAPPYSYVWRVNNQVTAVGVGAFTHQFDPNTGFAAEVCLTASDANGGTGNLCRVVQLPSGGATDCGLYFTHEDAFLPSDTSFLAHVDIAYTDPSGVTYRSAEAIQPANSYFQLLSAEPYLPNEKGEATYLLHLMFRAMLADPQGNALTMEITEATIAVAVPQ